MHLSLAGWRILAALLCWSTLSASGAEENTPPPALAAPVTETGESPAPSDPEPLGQIIGIADAPRDYLSQKFLDWVNSIDRFFADERNFQESRDSVLQLEAYRLYGYGGEHKVFYTGRAKVRLPNTERRLHLLIETDPDKNIQPDAARKEQVQPAQTPGSYAAGARYEQSEATHWHYSADGGLKFQGIHTTPFARARLSYTDRFGEWQMKAAGTLFWFNTIGIGETTQIDFERAYSTEVLFRATSNATWLYDKQMTDLRQDFTSFHTLDDRRGLMYQASIVGVNRPSTHVTDYVLLVLYRYRLHRQWIYLEFTPQVHFPVERQFQSSGALAVRIEMLFDDRR